MKDGKSEDDSKALAERALKAKMFAQRYAEITTALRREGVSEQRAREEARFAATMVYATPDYVDRRQPCPTCGRSDV